MCVTMEDVLDMKDVRDIGVCNLGVHDLGILDVESVCLTA